MSSRSAAWPDAPAPRLTSCAGTRVVPWRARSRVAAGRRTTPGGGRSVRDKVAGWPTNHGRGAAGCVPADSGPPGRSCSGPRTPRRFLSRGRQRRRERWKTGHPQQGRRPRGTGDRPPPPAWNATSATSGMTSRTRTRMSREARRARQRAATRQMETTASAMTTGKTSHRALELTANTKRPPGRAARRSVRERPARRSEGQAQGAKAAM